MNEIYPEIVVRDEAGEIYSVNYMALIPLLLKQIQELEVCVQEGKDSNRARDAHMQEQDAQIAKLYALLAALTA